MYQGKKLIIFDFDGTLINSVPDLTAATNKMLSKYGLSPLSTEEVTPFIGNGARALVQRALAYRLTEKEFAQELLDEALTVYSSAYENAGCNHTYLYSGVLDTLIYLKAKGYKMAICTNKPYKFIEPILEKLSIKNLFVEWIGEDSLEKKKPHPMPLLHLVTKTDSTLSNSIMIGDSRNDILAAQNAKIDSIGVSYGYNYNENIRESKPSEVVDNFSELKTLF